MDSIEVKQVELEHHDGVAVIRLNRPEVLNALTVEMFRELADAAERAAADETVEVVVLRGAGGHFCSGADLRELAGISGREQARAALAHVNRLLLQLHLMPKPVVSVIEGVAVGAGLNLALHADFVVATETAVLQEPFVHIGLATDFGGTFLLPRLVGMAQAKRLAMLGERITGTEAERIGLIYRAVPPAGLEAEVERLVGELRRLPRQGLAAIKEGLNQSGERTLEEMLNWEAQTQPELLMHPSFQSLAHARLNKTDRSG